MKYCKECNNKVSDRNKSGLCSGCCQKGSRNPWFGKKRPEHGILLSKKYLGEGNPMYGKKFKHKPNCQCCFCKCKRGETKGINAPNYVDGRMSLQVGIRSLEEYKNWRFRVYKRDNFTCQDCKNNSGGNLEAHHKKSFTRILQEFLQYYNQFSPIDDKETLIRLTITWKDFWDIDNGKTLCKNCHKSNYLKRVK